MSRDERLELIRELQARRGSKVVCYITSDRPPVSGSITDDVVRPIYRHMRKLGHVPKIDLFLYSRGGAVDVPWRIVSALRRTAEEWSVLIPFHANSAATLLALGADTIVLGAQGELGPIDPAWSTKRYVPIPGGMPTQVMDNISIEDVMAYVRFVRERWLLTEQEALTQASLRLADRVDAVSLGSIYRTHTHIRDVARQVLTSRRNPLPDDLVDGIVQMLAEKVYAHGHAINYNMAKAMGLQVEVADDETDALMWRLYESYEEDLKLSVPIDTAASIADSDVHEEESCLAVVESEAALDEHIGRIEVRARRAIPQTMTVNVTVNFTAPPNVEPEPGVEVVNKLKQMVIQQAQQAVQHTVSQIALTGIDSTLRYAAWHRRV